MNEINLWNIISDKNEHIRVLNSQLQQTEERADEFRVQRDFFLTRLEEEKERIVKLLAENAALKKAGVYPALRHAYKCPSCADYDTPSQEWTELQAAYEIVNKSLAAAKGEN